MSHCDWHSARAVLRSCVGLCRRVLSCGALMLLLACTNIGGRLLARGMARARDVSLRLALGASRAQVVRQLVTESLILSSAAALVGIGLAVFLIQLLRAIVPSLPLPIGVELR